LPSAAYSIEDYDARLTAYVFLFALVLVEITDDPLRYYHYAGSSEAEKSLGVGSSFKLYILSELAHQIADQTIPMEKTAKGEEVLSWNSLLPIQQKTAVSQVRPSN
jgi:hypothetical protein